MNPKLLAIVTFNKNEGNAINKLLDDLIDNRTSSTTQWQDIPNKIYRSISCAHLLEIMHYNLAAQGNVQAGSSISHLLENKKPDYILFYGCAGALTKELCEHAFIVAETKYISLGTVDKGTPCVVEKVTLKNKWFCPTDHTQMELPSIIFQPLSQYSVYNFCQGMEIDSVYVASTDKVIKVPPDSNPPNTKVGNLNIYESSEWSYSQAMAYVRELARNHLFALETIVDMETYGIGKLTDEHHLNDKVVIIRITTDALADKKEKDDQGQILIDGLTVVALFLKNMIEAIQGNP